MSNLIFSIAKSLIDYNNINDYVDVIFSAEHYGEKCLILKNLSLIDVYNYNYKNNYSYNYFCYIDAKCKLSDGFDSFILDKNWYLNYYNKKIYFLKFQKKLYDIFEIFENDLNENNFNFVNYLNDYFYCFNKNINFYLENKIVFPRHKMLYNAGYEKLKNKKHKSK